MRQSAELIGRIRTSIEAVLPTIQLVIESVRNDINAIFFVMIYLYDALRRQLSEQLAEMVLAICYFMLYAKVISSVLKDMYGKYSWFELLGLGLRLRLR